MSSVERSLLEIACEVPELASVDLAAFESKFSVRSYRPGEILIEAAISAPPVLLLLSGRARRLIQHRGSALQLERLEPGALMGWQAHVSVPHPEYLRASTTCEAMEIPAGVFSEILESHPDLREQLASRPGAGELFCLLEATEDPGRLATEIPELLPRARVLKLPTSTPADAALRWLQSDGDAKRRGTLWDTGEIIAFRGPQQRLIGLPARLKDAEAAPTPAAAPIEKSEAPPDPHSPRSVEFVAGSGERAEAQACLEMLCDQLGAPFRREVVRAALKTHLEQRPQLSLQRVGAVCELAGLATQPQHTPWETLAYVDTPFLLRTNGHLSVVQNFARGRFTLASPATGLSTASLAELRDGEAAEILIVRRGRDAQAAPFGLRWFLPEVKKHWRPLIEVLVASVFIQLFTLANPLLIQLIIDKVIVQESVDTLHVLGSLLLVVTVFASLLTAIRTFLFVDTTNRIDISLGLKIVEHLYRLPLGYFQKRPVGEVSSRLRELEKIRQFLTGTALTVVLDVLFSLVYIAIMLVYSILLSAVALIAVPLLAAITLGVAPIVRRQHREVAEKHARTEAHLVESLTGIQTIKAQNLETGSRWKWHERYVEKIAAEFRNVLTSTSANSLAQTINKFGDVAVLWVGVYLVIDGKLTLGQLIAFRIVAGYVTAPLVRLAQTWQNFQEVAVSCERLGDVLNNPREDAGDSRSAIPMPELAGAVRMENLSFGYNPGKLQLRNINLSLPAGTFVGMVGLSGSGKSTLLKVLARLYEPTEGCIEVDGFDINKVELTSYRSQLGLVFQETLLFDGSLFENIAAGVPDAQPEDIVEAARIACAHEFIMGLPGGYSFLAGEQGRALSGGQRQRVALARVMLEKPRMLMLDEATSALDIPTEREVCTNLRRAFSGRSVFFATHRLKSVEKADIILFMEGGALVEKGTHEELMASRGRYYSLYIQQEAGIA